MSLDDALNLENALNFIEECGDESYRVGVITLNEIDLILYGEGDMVVFRDSDPDEETLLQIRHEDISEALTIRTPYSPEVIQAHTSDDISILSYNIVSGVPPGCIKEIRSLDDL